MPRKKLPRHACKYCSAICDRPEKRYCTNSCHGKYLNEERARNGTLKHRSAKYYLMRTKGAKCEICKNTEWNRKTIPLVLDHINGVHDDNSLENLRLVCGNCDMQLPTYKKKNLGKGRAYRRERYSKGLTY